MFVHMKCSTESCSLEIQLRYHARLATVTSKSSQVALSRTLPSGRHELKMGALVWHEWARLLALASGACTLSSVAARPRQLIQKAPPHSLHSPFAPTRRHSLGCFVGVPGPQILLGLCRWQPRTARDRVRRKCWGRERLQNCRPTDDGDDDERTHRPPPAANAFVKLIVDVPIFQIVNLVRPSPRAFLERRPKSSSC